MNKFKKKLVYGVLGMLSLTLSLAFSTTANTSLSRVSYQGEYTGNCYCNISGSDCACVVVE